MDEARAIPAEAVRIHELAIHQLRGVGMPFEEPRYGWNVRLDQVQRIFDAILILTLPDGVGRDQLCYPNAPLYYPGRPALDRAEAIIAARGA